MKLFDSEWKVMDELWENGDLSAKELSQRLNSCVGWNKNTTYTVIKNVWTRAQLRGLSQISSAMRSFPGAKRHRRFWTGRLTAQQSS